jgi:hypothetical protein
MSSGSMPTEGEQKPPQAFFGSPSFFIDIYTNQGLKVTFLND